ncbi:(deoxy)nucleoside triphosphate pyrophosphohydrolase [Rhodoflexus sp.]
MSRTLSVTCAIIVHEGRVLAAQRAVNRSQGGLWEFPGGKMHAGETAEECIRREIAEELGAAVRIIARLPDCVHHYPDKSIRLIPFVCEPEKNADFQLIEHNKIRWCADEELHLLDWCAADVPVLRQYLAWKFADEKPD